MQASKIVDTADIPIRSHPPSGFGYPLDGFVPSTPGRLCFTPTALMGFALRSFLHSSGTRGVSAVRRPAYRLLPPVTPAAKAVGRPGGPRFPGFQPRKRPLRAARDEHADRWMLPWAYPFQGSPAKASAEISPGLLPRAFHRQPRPPARRHGVSISLRPAPSAPGASAKTDRATLLGFLRLANPEHSHAPALGL